MDGESEVSNCNLKFYISSFWVQPAITNWQDISGNIQTFHFNSPHFWTWNKNYSDTAAVVHTLFQKSKKTFLDTFVKIASELQAHWGRVSQVCSTECIVSEQWYKMFFAPFFNHPREH